MQQYLDEINTYLLKLAHLRRERALIGMPETYQSVFQLLPLLFHFNDPNLPGYVEECDVYGISHYDPNTAPLPTCLSSDWNPIKIRTPRIAGLYTMGSTFSLGQSVFSDLDVWVCIEYTLTQSDKIALQKKCNHIEAWANQQNVKLSLFIVDVNRFRNKHHDCLIGDNCGSTQHMLLLEEFYRTATVLAGKLLLWFRIPLDLNINGVQYASYEACIDALVNANVLDLKDWVDFGPLVSLSAEEYFGASLWQLYKSIDAPYKAVLKSLLLEAYSWEYPKTHFIAYQMNETIHQFREDYYSLDPYYMLLDKISHYLIQIKDRERLTLARECFYIKVNEKLSVHVPKMTWRRKTILKLVTSWGWDKNKIKWLDQCHQWKIEQVRPIYDNVLDAMMTSYRNLLNFGRRNNIESLISPRDLAILTRKLYATYEVLPGKITVINRHIAADLNESVLTFIHVKEDRINRAGWYVYNKAPDMKYTSGCHYLEYSPHLSKLIAWCYFNNLITKNTELYFWDNGNKNNRKLRQIITDLQAHFPLTMPKASEEALYAPSEIRQLALLINVEKDVTEHMRSQHGRTHASTIDVFSYGPDKISLISSIDLLYRNSWNEIRMVHFNDTTALLDALRTLLNRMHKAADNPDGIEIYGYSKFLNHIITDQVRSLINECIELRLSSAEQNLTKFKPLCLAGYSYGLFFERLGVSIHRFESTLDFYSAISNNKLQGHALNIADQRNELPEEIDRVACEGIIQFIFEDTNQGFDLYILNEFNQFEIYRNCNGNKHNMIKDVNEFYTLADDRFTFAASSSINFNLPQFYQITHDLHGKRDIIPYS